MIHNFYNQLTTTEKKFVDDMFSHSVFVKAKELGIKLDGSDAAERAVEGVAKWVVESRGL